jgi:hypothetical protein
VAVLGTRGAHDEAFALARAIYVSPLRPRSLDELRARILGGDPAPPGAAKDLQELAELRGSITSEDTASRRLLASIAAQLNVEAILVVSSTLSPGEPEAGEDAGAPALPHPLARLFLRVNEEFDAARYEPDPDGGWKGTAASLTPRFPPPLVSVAELPKSTVTMGDPHTVKMPVSEGKERKPFYSSPWLWAGVGAAVLIGAFFLFASQDTSKAPIHLQMQVPH